MAPPRERGAAAGEWRGRAAPPWGGGTGEWRGRAAPPHRGASPSSAPLMTPLAKQMHMRAPMFVRALLMSDDMEGSFRRPFATFRKGLSKGKGHGWPFAFRNNQAAIMQHMTLGCTGIDLREDRLRELHGHHFVTRTGSRPRVPRGPWGGHEECSRSDRRCCIGSGLLSF